MPIVDKIFQTFFNVNRDLWRQELLKRNNQSFGSNHIREVFVTCSCGVRVALVTRSCDVREAFVTRSFSSRTPFEPRHLRRIFLLNHAHFTLANLNLHCNLHAKSNSIMKRKSSQSLSKIYFWTATIHNWLPLLNSDENKELIIDREHC